MTDARRPDPIRIQNACPKKWGELVGGDAKRYCEACDLHVHNSEALTRVEAEELVRDADERVCMRIVRDEAGAPVFRDSAAALARRAARWALATGAGLLAACKDQPAEVTGVVAPGHPTGGESTSTVGDVARPADFEILGKVCPPEELEPVDVAPEGLGRVAPIQDGSVPEKSER